MCSQAGYSRQAYYEHFKCELLRNIEYSRVLSLVLLIRQRHPHLGVRKIYFKINPIIEEYGIKLGRDGLFNLLRDNGLLVKYKHKYHKTSNGKQKHKNKEYPNLIKGLIIERSNNVWVSDITYIRTNEGFGYLSLISDAYSRKILGYNLSKDLGSISCCKSLKVAPMSTA